MKYLLPFLLLTWMTFSCQSNENTSGDDDINHEVMHDDHNMDHSADEHDHAPIHDTSLELNDGNKWETDAPTKQNAEHMKSVTNQFQASNPSTLADFKEYGSEIKAGLDKMIRECTMTGAEDQALHQWFFPILENTGEIAKTDDVERAKHLSHEIIDRVNVYDQYFE